LPQTWSILHPHQLTWTSDLPNHTCDVCQVHKNLHYFRCACCDFDMCVSCFLASDTAREAQLIELLHMLRCLPSDLVPLIVQYDTIVSINQASWTLDKNYIPTHVGKQSLLDRLQCRIPGMGENLPYKFSDPVWGCSQEGWLLGTISNSHKKYVQVQYYEAKKHYQWFHVESNDIKLFKSRLAPMTSFEREWFKGRIIEVKDHLGEWKQAEVLLVEKRKIFISYLNSTEKFNKWLNLDDKLNLQRVRTVNLSKKTSLRNNANFLQ